MFILKSLSVKVLVPFSLPYILVDKSHFFTSKNI